jgi:SAM-dependent methyltransferase
MDVRTLVKRAIWTAMRIPPLGEAVVGYYQRKPPAYVPGWNREHPFDRANGVQTSGALPSFVLGPGTSIAYGAAQPSIVRRALAAIPDRTDCHFLDIGCGKGRPLFIASEIGFRSVTGIEFSAPLIRIARRNVAAFSRAYPDRKPVNIVAGDALDYTLPAERLVIFLYNPFDRPAMAQLLGNIEASLRTTPRDLYIIYYNPVFGDLLDGSASLERRYAAQVPYDSSEMGYGPQTSDAVIVWQNRGNPHPRPPGDPNLQVSIVFPGRLAEIAPQ